MDLVHVLGFLESVFGFLNPSCGLPDAGGRKGEDEVMWVQYEIR